MIGNDIVDLQKASLESDWRRRGYLDKLFCPEEQELIFMSQNPDQMVWLLWSMKEACYKIYFREKLVRTYQPRSIICSNLLIMGNCASGRIQYKDQHYFSRSTLTTDFVHSVVVSNYSNFKDLHLFIDSHKPDPNGLVNNNNQDFVNARRYSGYFLIKSRHNVPNLLNRITGEKRPISISHHGRYLSAIFFKQ